MGDWLSSIFNKPRVNYGTSPQGTGEMDDKTRNLILAAALSQMGQQLAAPKFPGQNTFGQITGALGAGGRANPI